MTMKWSSWPPELCRDNYLCLKKNLIYENLELMVKSSVLSLGSDNKVGDIFLTTDGVCDLALSTLLINGMDVVCRQFDPTISLFSELRYASRKSFRKYCFEFSKYALSYRKDSKVGWGRQNLHMIARI